MHLTDKEKINLITHYFYSGSFSYENERILALNVCSLHTDNNNLLKLYKSQIELDIFNKISADIEKILFD